MHDLKVLFVEFSAVFDVNKCFDVIEKPVIFYFCLIISKSYIIKEQCGTSIIFPVI